MDLGQSPRFQDLCSLMNTRSAHKILSGPSSKVQQHYCFYCKTQVQETHQCSYLKTFVKMDRLQMAVYQDDNLDKLIGTDFGEPTFIKHFKFRSDMINYLHHDAIDKHYIRHNPQSTTLDSISCHMYPYAVQCINKGLMRRSKAPFTPIKDQTIIELTPNPWAERLMKEYHKYMKEDDPKKLNIYHVFHRIHAGKVASILFGYLNMDIENEQPKQHLLGIVQQIEWPGDELTDIPPQLFHFLKCRSSCKVDGKEYRLSVRNELTCQEEVEERIKAGKRVMPR